MTIQQAQDALVLAISGTPQTTEHGILRCEKGFKSVARKHGGVRQAKSKIFYLDENPITQRAWMKMGTSV